MGSLMSCPLTLQTELLLQSGLEAAAAAAEGDRLALMPQAAEVRGFRCFPPSCVPTPPHFQSTLHCTNARTQCMQ